MPHPLLQSSALSASAPIARITGKPCVPSRIAYVVSDDEQLAGCIRSMTEGSGIHLKWFQSASGYFAYTRPVVASCLFISRRMSDMSGLDFQRELAPTMSPPIIFLSDDWDISLCVRAIRQGAYDFLNLPLIASQLLGTLESAFRKDEAAIAVRQEDEDLLRRWRSLTSREAEVMRYAVAGFLNKQTAGELRIAENTVQVHRGRVMRKMCANSFAALVRMSIRLAEHGEYSMLHLVTDPTRENRSLVA
jgi:FixJ family two-component response regulator